MKKLTHIALLSALVFGAGSLADSTPAYAYFHHHHKTHHHKVKHSRTSAMVHDAQISLIHLHYLNGPADGLMGPRTRGAIMHFQRDHGMRADGVLSRPTYNAIIRADSTRAMAVLPMPAPIAVLPIRPPNDIMASQPGLTGPVNDQFSDPLIGGKTVVADAGNAQAVRTQELTSRFAKIDINENKNGQLRRYTLTLDGIPILMVNNQPSIIGISPTYAFDTEDAIILTTFHDGDPVCAYKYYLLTLTHGQNEIRPVGNCTHGYQARKVEDSLFITFPEVDDQRVAGATWRYENGDLEKL